MKPLHIFTLAVALVAPSPTRTPTEPMQNSSVVPLYDQFLGPSATQQVAYTVVPVPSPTATGSDSADDDAIINIIPQEVLDAAEELKDEIAGLDEAALNALRCRPRGYPCYLGRPGILPPPPRRCCPGLRCYGRPGSITGNCYRHIPGIP